MIEHPFLAAGNLSDKTMDELQNTLSDLYKKYGWAQRVGNGPLQHQLLMLIESYRTAYSRKLDETMKKQNTGNLINIDRTQRSN